MIQSCFNENRSVFFRVLSDDQVWEIRRAAFDILEKTGAKDMAKRTREKVKKIIETHQVPSLPDKTLAAIEKLKTKGEKELTNHLT